VFDGLNGLPAGFSGALRDRAGNDVVRAHEFGIGQLVVMP
jgi:hypothetical protein